MIQNQCIINRIDNHNIPIKMFILKYTNIKYMTKGNKHRFK